MNHIRHCRRLLYYITTFSFILLAGSRWQLGAQSQLTGMQLMSPRSRLLSVPPGSMHDSFVNSPRSFETNPLFGESMLNEEDFDELDDVLSIERLTKSCLTIQARSASPEDLNVTFRLYTRRNPYTPYIFGPQISRLELLESSPFDPRRGLKWIIHGFHSSADKSEWMHAAKDKVLAHEDTNVILTDWHRGASPALLFYPKAAANAHLVAQMIAMILDRIRLDIDFLRVHLIGHSLGAQIMGFVGNLFTEEYTRKQAQQLMMRPHIDPTLGSNPHLGFGSRIGGSGQLIGRITGCDPALPCFGAGSKAAKSAPSTPIRNSFSDIPSPMMRSYSDSNLLRYPGLDDSQLGSRPILWTHLKPDSAVQVDVIHTNPGVMGYADPLGDFDFYLNGFERQPGCGPHSPIRDSRSIEPINDIGVHKTPVKSKSVLSRLPLVGKLFKPRSDSSLPIPAPISNSINHIIKPITDIVQGFRCSHHRSVQYMVESMYYDQVPQNRKLDPGFVCQMVGYRCSDYESFKRGYCFTCMVEGVDCRSFTIARSIMGPSASDISRSQFNSILARKMTALTSNTQDPAVIARKRIFSTLHSDHHSRSNNYLEQDPNKYFLHTEVGQHQFCAHHYHLLVKYRWFRVSEALTLSGFKITGTMTSVSNSKEKELNRYTHQTFTHLFTHPSFLGRIESLLLIGEKIKPMMIEYVEITYMSNLDPQVRAFGSARLCRQSEPWLRPSKHQSHYSSSNEFNQKGTLFLRC